MYGRSHATPLLGLDAVVLDIETTGLDPAKARLVEAAAIRLDGGDPAKADAFQQRVNPGEPIPGSSTAIHGIDDAAVATAPSFTRLWPTLNGYLGESIVIGHSLGFDLAVLKHECERAGLSWTPPRALDTGLLARLVAPRLPGYSLEELAAWLMVKPGERHSAYGDALTTARIFRALLPKLRDREIRTLAEAESACRKLTTVLDKEHQAGWVGVVASPDTETSPARVDTYPYRHRVRDVMSTPPKFIAGATPLGAALNQMAAERVSSLYVVTEPHDSAALARPGSTGILTERDVLRAIAAKGADALAMPVSDAMSSPLASVPDDAFVYRAIARMNLLKYRHLGVTGEDGGIVGALSARDLLRLRAFEAIALDDEIDQASDAAALARASAKLPHVASALLAEELSGRDVAAVISRELGALTARAAVLAEQRLIESGDGPPPCAYAVAVLGSAGREESLLAFDQDNALVFAQGEPDGPEDRWFEKLGISIADILNEIGVPYCRGGVMAKNPQWRGSVSTWRKRIQQWISRTTTEGLLSIDIFFDLRSVHGERELAHTIRSEAFDAAKGQAAFAKLLAESAGRTASGLNFFGGFKTQDGRIDLKHTGLFGVVTFARVLAIRYDIRERSTPGRLAALQARDLGAASDLDALAEAQELFLDLILRQQLDDIRLGVKPTNAVLVKRLTRPEKERLRKALAITQQLEELTRDLLFRD